MRIIKPEGIKSQRFGQNANSYYKEDGLIGHPGTDFVNGYGTPLNTLHEGYVYKVLNKYSTDPMRYKAVCTLIESDLGTFELIYGHLSEIFVETGQPIKTLEPFGKEGNTGKVASYGRKITKEEKLSGSTAGSHTHYQLRPVIRVKELYSNEHYLNDARGNAYQDSNGNYYRVLLKNNGYRGCIDASTWFFEVEKKDKLKMFMKTLIYLLKKVVNKLINKING